ncbi:hypothetical protein IG631_24300, partial [Alternaria alternata]
SFFILSIFAIVITHYTTLESPKTFSESLEKSIEVLHMANDVTPSMPDLANTIRSLDGRQTSSHNDISDVKSTMTGFATVGADRQPIYQVT